jgi:hypothetical protein
VGNENVVDFIDVAFPQACKDIAASPIKTVSEITWDVFIFFISLSQNLKLIV